MMWEADQGIRRPNFFIVGAPKCGTTAMARYLAEHPRVFLSEPKEPEYFIRHLLRGKSRRQIPSHCNSLEHYLELFRGVPDSCRAVGEASVQYIRSERALHEIAEFSPQSRIIAMLRNPVELVRSYHAECLLHLHENEEDIERAWDLQEQRVAGHRIPPGSQKTDQWHYAKIASLGDQVETLLRIFPEDRVLLVFHEDFAEDPGSVYRRLLSFLGVADDGRTEFPRLNPRKRGRHGLLLRVAKEWQTLRYVSEWMKAKVGVDSWGIVRRIQSAKEVEPQARPSLRPEFHDRLVDYFEPDVLKLQELTGRDLTHWLRRSGQKANAPQQPSTSA